MDTAAHVVLNLVVQARPSQSRVFILIITGAMLPDLPIFIFYAWESWIVGSSESAIWSTRYFLPGWQNFIDVFNSIPIILLLLTASVLFRFKPGTIVLIGMLLHVLFDIPLHNDDAHRHFYPISDWKFFSPVSYWDPRFYGELVHMVQIIGVAIGLIWLWIRHCDRIARVCVVALGGVYVGYQIFVFTVWAG